ncbi:hypothetical protein RB653_007187 [Dictyostelium firmibasis]|uniref:Uncharacterized protein n=1 Tax=Dictyostelium firmibasis TaxID=79012 RepID=A0AAN7YLV3_9MYCE
MEQMNTVFGQVAFTEEEIASISQTLNESVPLEDVSTRQGPGGTTLSYLESWKAINLANKIFQFNGWSSSIKELSPDFIEEITVNGLTRYRVGVTAIVRVTLKDGTFQEDVGYGSTEHPSKGSAIENAKKEAVSDARKRTLRLFGDRIGNSLYDKDVNKNMGVLVSNEKKKQKQAMIQAASAAKNAPQQPQQQPQQQQQPQKPQQQPQQPQQKAPAKPMIQQNKPAPSFGIPPKPTSSPPKTGPSLPMKNPAISHQQQQQQQQQHNQIDFIEPDLGDFS